MKNIISSLSRKRKTFLYVLILIVITGQYLFIPIVTSKTIILCYVMFIVNYKMGQVLYYLNLIERNKLVVTILRVTSPIVALRIVIEKYTQLDILCLALTYFLFTYSIVLSFKENEYQ